MTFVDRLSVTELTKQPTTSLLFDGDQRELAVIALA
jgi:hypothetical protein